MIRYSDKSDINDIVFLWKEAFGDSEEEIMFFINRKYKPENTIVFEADGKIASMLFLLEGEIKISNKYYPSYYLYAACTLNEYRGKGIMSSLLNFTKETANNRGYRYICLLPANKSLYKYYEKYGYKTVFKKKIVKISPDSVCKTSKTTKYDCSELYNLRNKAFENIDMFVWDNDSINFAFEHHKLYGGQAQANCKGYMLYNKIKQEIYVKEFCFTDINSNLLSDFETANQISINLPVDYAVESEQIEIIDSGMILPIDKDAEEILNSAKNPYLGLTLD